MAGESVPLLKDDAYTSSGVRGMRIVIKGLSYTVRSNVKRGQLAYLLDDVNGYFNPGQMSCLIGPSGSGKTTLMDVLAGRKTQGTINGTIRFSNRPPSKMFLRRYTGYVEQFDTLLESLTVKEMLIYTAELKRPMEEKYGEKVKRVEELMKKLSLTASADRKIGQQGGLKKRVNIGIALITEPRVLFLDEPTTGLDSNTANDIMTVVKNLVMDGTTICSTIHSPTPYTFSLFDRVLFLLRGKVVFFGERDQAVPFLEAFASQDGQEYDNEAEWLTAVMVKAEREDQGPEFAEKFAGSNLKADADRAIEDFLLTDGDADEETQRELAVKQSTATPLWFAFKTLIKYRTAKNLCDPGFWGPRMMEKLVFSILIVITYYGIGDNFKQSNMTNTAAALFLIVVLPTFGAGIYTPTLVMERALLYRELDDGLYRPGVYLLAKMLDEVVVALVCTFVFATFMWYMVSFSGSIIYLWAIYFGHLFNGIGMAYICASVAPDVNVANAMLQTVTIIIAFFAGLFILPDDIPIYWSWAYILNYVAYGFSAVMVNQFEEHDDRIREGEGGLEVLKYYNIDDKDKKLNTGIVYIFSAGFLLIAYLAMTFIRHQKR